MPSLAVAFVLVLRIYDVAGASPREVVQAEQAASSILGQAHIEAAWIACRTPQAQETPDARCAEQIRPSEFVVRVVAGSPQPDGPLGEAHVDVGSATGAVATIFLARVRRLAADAGMDAGTLMGRAIAHEAGHLLFGDASHSSTGLMRPHWSAAALRAEAPRAWTFSSREARRLQERMIARLALDPQSPLVEGLPPHPRPCGTHGLACQQNTPGSARHAAMPLTE
jgi:hypothetical protein